MRYTKQPLTFDEQADLLLQRGLIANRDKLIRRLQATNYFRLTGYIYRFRQSNSDQLIEGTKLEQVWKYCLFDQRLRTLILDAIEAIEVYTRTQLAYRFAHKYGAFDYHNPTCLPKLRPDSFLTWQRKLGDQVSRSLQSREEFLVHFFDKYGDEHTRPPIWTLVELMDFGTMLTFHRGVFYTIRQDVALPLGIPDRVFESWLLALHTVRNRCAHHLRLWNWKLGTPVRLPNDRKYPLWHHAQLPNDRLGIILTLCRHLLNQISPSNEWSKRVIQHFNEFPEIPVSEMGLPSDWQNHPLWKPEV